jgi:hypothetical protein
MFNFRKEHLVVLYGLMVLFAAGSSATPRAQVPLGDLMCRLEKVNKTDAENSAQIRNIDCVYQRSRSGNLEFYNGTLTIVGPERLLKNNRVLSWVVRGPMDSDTQPGSLAQSYGGASDGQALSLAGDKRTSVTLIESNPVSKSAHFVTEMQLKLQEAPA